jgi:hypothetical protein
MNRFDRFDLKRHGMYMSPIGDETIYPENRFKFGYIANLYRVNYHLNVGYLWMLDNSVYTGYYTYDRWIKRLEECLPYRETCIGVVIPDVVGDYQETLKNFASLRHIPKEMGYPIALASQDGLTSEMTPWQDIDVLFIGGTDEHKLGVEAALLIEEGRNRGVWIHVGRVNSPSRIEKFFLANSWDGTTLVKDPSQQNKLLSAVAIANRLKVIYDSKWSYYWRELKIEKW